MARKKKQPSKEFILMNLSRREFAKKRGKVIATEIESGRPLDLPPGYDPRKGSWSWEQIYGVFPDPRHSGQPIYELRESQTARVTKIVGPTRQ
jgi:hypothetical protein